MRQAFVKKVWASGSSDNLAVRWKVVNDCGMDLRGYANARTEEMKRREECGISMVRQLVSNDTLHLQINSFWAAFLPLAVN